MKQSFGSLNRGALGLASLLVAVLPAAAEEAGSTVVDSSRRSLVESASESEHLTGDWGGWRSRLVERGVHFQAGYIGETFGNPSGGLRRGAIYEGLAEAAVEFDLERLTGFWPGAMVRASALFPHGRSPTSQLIGDLQALSNIDAYDSIALYELWLEQELWNGRLSLRAGQLLADAEFAFTESAGPLMNSSFGWPAFISANTRNTGPAFFRAAPGIRVRLDTTSSVYVQAAVYDGDTFDNDAGRQSGNPHGTNFRLSERQGAFAIGEAGWRLHQEEQSSGLPGAYKIGAWLHTGEFVDRFSPARTHSLNHGFYAAGEQMVWRESEESRQGLGLFLRGGLSPGDRNLLSVGWDAGINYLGLLPGRDADLLALGVTMVVISEDTRRAERAAGATVLSDREIVLELAYHLNLKPWLSIQPDVQWLHHPGGSAAIDDALVVGLRSRFTF